MSKLSVFISFQKMAFQSLYRPNDVCYSLMYGATELLEEKLKDPEWKSGLRGRVRDLHGKTMNEHIETTQARLQEMYLAKMSGDEDRFKELWRLYGQEERNEK